MSFFRKLFSKDKTAEVSGGAISTTTAQPDSAIAQQPNDKTQPLSKGAQVFIPGPPHTNVSATQNAGMLGGAVLGGETGTGAGVGAMDGLVVGNLVGQQINQAKKHEYWREQALNYGSGLPAAGIGDPNVITPTGPRDRSHREEKRKNRWSRRAERRAD